MGNQQSTTRTSLSNSKQSQQSSIDSKQVLSEPTYSQLLSQHINYMKHMLITDDDMPYQTYDGSWQ